MKSYKEVADSVLERSGAIIKEKNTRKKKIMHIFVALTPCVVIAMITAVVFYSVPYDIPPDTVSVSGASGQVDANHIESNQSLGNIGMSDVIVDYSDVYVEFGSVSAGDDSTFLDFSTDGDFSVSNPDGDDFVLESRDENCFCSDDVSHSDSDITGDSSMPTEVSDSPIVYYVTSLAEAEVGEFAADMHRPEGYDKNIGSALALKMSIADKSDCRFSVIVRIPNGSSLVELMAKANDTMQKESLDPEMAMPLYISGEPDVSDKFFCWLMAEQIIALAYNGAECSYVGSGEGNYTDMNWDTSKGIDAYCELNGDMYVFGTVGVESNPDIYVSE